MGTASFAQQRRTRKWVAFGLVGSGAVVNESVARRPPVRHERWWVFGAVGVAAVVGMLLAFQALIPVAAMTAGYSGGLTRPESLLVETYKLARGTVFLRTIAHRLVLGKTTDSERIATLVAWTHENVRPPYAAPDRVVGGSVYDITRRGFGYCDQSAHVFSTLAHYAGYDARTIRLRRANGVSPHTLAEVRVGDRWILVDPWLGIILRDDAGNLMSVADVEGQPQLLDRFGYSSPSLSLTAQDFTRAEVFRTFPYQGIGPFIAKVSAKIRRLPVFSPSVSVVPSGAQPAPLEVSQEPSNDHEVLRQQIALYDAARIAHLDGRYAEALGLYERLVQGAFDRDIADSTRFFIGLAFLRNGQAKQAIGAFRRALREHPDTAWRNSILYYRAEAKAAVGARDGAIVDLQAAGTISAQHRLRELRFNRDVGSSPVPVGNHGHIR